MQLRRCNKGRNNRLCMHAGIRTYTSYGHTCTCNTNSTTARRSGGRCPWTTLSTAPRPHLTALQTVTSVPPRGARRHSFARARRRLELDSSSSSLLDLVLLRLLDLVLLRLLLSGARPEAWRGRGRGLCGGEVQEAQLTSSKLFGAAAPWRCPRRSSSA